MELAGPSNEVGPSNNGLELDATRHPSGHPASAAEYGGNSESELQAGPQADCSARQKLRVQSKGKR